VLGTPWIRGGSGGGACPRSCQRRGRSTHPDLGQAAKVFFARPAICSIAAKAAGAWAATADAAYSSMNLLYGWIHFLVRTEPDPKTIEPSPTVKNLHGANVSGEETAGASEAG